VEPSPVIRHALWPALTQAVCAAAELGLADELVDGPRTVHDLAAATGSHPPSLLRLLRVLTALDVVVPTGPDQFALGVLGDQLLSDSPTSVRSFVRLVGKPGWWDAWSGLVTSVRTGETSFEKVVGTPVFEYVQQHPDEAALFAEAMRQRTRQVAPEIVGAYDFSRFGTVVDVGGGDGTLLTHILEAAPETRGVLFELGPTSEVAAGVLEAADMSERCKVVPGDFFVSVPEGGDAYVLKTVVHDWDDEQAVVILRNCRQAMAPDGRVLVIETLVPDVITSDDADVLMVDMTMLVLAGGRERTQTEYRVLLAAAGLRVTSVSDPLPPARERVIEAVAAA
jgi:orsellinic acid C2-O-methyltransferase